MTKRRSYTDLIKFPTYEERFKYLKLDGVVSYPTFDAHRYLNQTLYQSYEWRKARREAIIRDRACDLGVEGRQLNKYIVVHHINPISIEDILNEDHSIFDLDNLICASKLTHNAIHFSDETILPKSDYTRIPGDTKLW